MGEIAKIISGENFGKGVWMLKQKVWLCGSKSRSLGDPCTTLSSTSPEAEQKLRN